MTNLTILWQIAESVNLTFNCVQISDALSLTNDSLLHQLCKWQVISWGFPQTKKQHCYSLKHSFFLLQYFSRWHTTVIFFLFIWGTIKYTLGSLNYLNYHVFMFQPKKGGPENARLRPVFPAPWHKCGHYYAGRQTIKKSSHGLVYPALCCPRATLDVRDSPISSLYSISFNFVFSFIR